MVLVAGLFFCGQLLAGLCRRSFLLLGLLASLLQLGLQGLKLHLRTFNYTRSTSYQVQNKYESYIFTVLYSSLTLGTFNLLLHHIKVLFEPLQLPIHLRYLFEDGVWTRSRGLHTY